MSDVTFGVKVPEDLKEQLQKLMSDSGLTGKDFMQQILTSYTMEKAKETIPVVAEDLKELQSLTQRINNIYLSLGYRIENISKDLLAQQETEMIKKDSTISDLQDKNYKALNDNEIITESYNDTVNQNNEYLQRVNELTESNNTIKELIEEYKSKNDMLLGDLAEHKQFKVQLEEYKKLLADSQERNITKDNIIRDNDYTITQLNKSNEKLIQDNQREIELMNKDNEKLVQENQREVENLKKENQNGIDQLNKESSLNIKLAVAEIKEELNGKLLSLQSIHNEVLEKNQAKYNTEILQYQTKYKDLLQDLEQSKKTNAI